LLDFSISIVSWKQAQSMLVDIRTQVFILEQQVPVELEWDELDANAIHLLAQDKLGKPLGCARITDQGKIGRMAVLKSSRGKGIGKALLNTAIEQCRARHWLDISLSAQTYAIGFYEKTGFMVCSDVYMDAGIPHRDMKLHLTY
jgi:predicted GNAT family N-acyltransferase